MTEQELKQLRSYLKAKTFSKRSAISNTIFLEEAYREKAIEEKIPCAKCGRFKEDMMTIDHIVPRSILEQLGVDVMGEFDIENVQIMCRPCNQFKANRLDFTNLKTKQILLQAINNLQ